MTAQMTRTNCPIKIKTGDILQFTNNTGSVRTVKVTRVEEKSWYAKGRNSYGTLMDYANSFKDFEII